jgi:hypothetical protein
LSHVRSTWLLFLAAGCGPVIATAVVPHVEPTARTLAPLDGHIELAAHGSVQSTAASASDTSSLIITRYEGEAEVRFPVDKNVDFDLIGGLGSQDGIPTRSTVNDGVSVQPVPTTITAAPWEVGVGLQATVPIGRNVRDGFAMRLLVLDAPWSSFDASGRDWTLITSFAYILRWEVESHLAIVTSLSLENLPATADANGFCLSIEGGCSQSPSISFGNYYLVAAMGVEYHDSGYAIAAQLFGSQGLGLDGNTVSLGPGLLVSLEVPLPK